MTQNLYEVLEIEKGASQDEIQRAYRKLALKYHPDRVAEEHKETAERIFKELNFAYSILKDKIKKIYYDVYGITDNTEVETAGESILKKFCNGIADGLANIGEHMADKMADNFNSAVKSDASLRKCWDCKGAGEKIEETGFFVKAVSCDTCDGTGWIEEPPYLKPNKFNAPFYKVY